MTDFFKRLDEFMEFKGLNDNQITVETGISNGLIGKGRVRGTLSQKNISKILYTYPDLNANWLLMGRGEMIIQEMDSIELSTDIGREKTYLEDIQEKLIKSQEREIAELKNQLRSCNCHHKFVEKHK